VQTPTAANNNNQLSIIIVEVIGYGGEGGDDKRQPENQQLKNNDKRGSCDPNGMFRVLGNGALTEQEKASLTAEGVAEIE